MGSESYFMEDLVILGSGCAGMTAAIYAARSGISPLVFEGSQPGGQITTTSEIENFPGFPDGIDGFGLVWNMRQQAEKFGARIESAMISSVDFSGEVKKLISDSGKVYESKKVIIATGSSPRMTGAKGEKEMFGGKGVTTCATCDGAFYRNMDVVVIGGGDTACEEAIFLTRFCSSVKIIHRRDTLRASQIMSDRALKNPKIVAIWDSIVEEILPDENGKCRGIIVKNVKSGEKSEISCKGVFIAIGHIPNTAIFKGWIDLDEEGFVKTKDGSTVKTSSEGVWVAGDCADRQYRQAIVAAGSGAMAAIEASVE